MNKPYAAKSSPEVSPEGVSITPDSQPDPRRSILKLLNVTMLELMLLDYDGVNSKEVTQWITEELQERRRPK